jgi:hypothetical protein
VKVLWLPQDGTHLLMSRPNTELKPEPFVAGSRKQLEKTYSSIKRWFSHKTDDNDTILKWRIFVDEVCPQSDNVNEFVDVLKSRNEYKIPMERVLKLQVSELVCLTVLIDRLIVLIAICLFD